MDPNQNKKNNKNNRGRMRGVASLILWALVLVVVFQYINAYTGNAANKTTSHEIKYSQLIEMVKADEVKSSNSRTKRSMPRPSTAIPSPTRTARAIPSPTRRGSRSIPRS